MPISIYVVVQFYPWFKFSFLFSYKLNIIHYHTQKQKKRKFKPGIKLNHNIYITQGTLLLVSSVLNSICKYSDQLTIVSRIMCLVENDYFAGKCS